MQEASNTLTTGLCHAAVGIPQGLMTDPDTGELVGIVRRGGKLVSLEPVEYGIWSMLLTPLTAPASAELAASNHWGDAAPVIDRLEGLMLLVAIDPAQPMNAALAQLRPIPQGCGLGNAGGDPTRFELQNATFSLSPPLALDLLSTMFWWEFDGTTSLQEAASSIMSRNPELPPERVSAIATFLACALMRDRMLYLDTPRTERS